MCPKQGSPIDVDVIIRQKRRMTWIHHLLNQMVICDNLHFSVSYDMSVECWLLFNIAAPTSA